MMMSDVSVCNCNVGIHFDSFQVGSETAARFMLGVYSLQNLVFLTVSREPPPISPADNPGADKTGLRDRPGWLEVYT